MITHTLSEREKQAIDAILSQAEEEYLQIPTTSIEKIDDQCRSLWPDWDPNSIRNKQENTEEQSINQNIDSYDINYDNLMQRHIEYEFDMTNINEHENDQASQPNDMKVLRKEAESLLSRIHQTVEIENPPQISEKPTVSTKSRQTKKMKSSIQSLYTKDNSTSESGKDELTNKKKKRTKNVFISSASNSISTESQESQQQSIIRPKNKAQAKQVIASASREMKVVESENQMLKKRLAEMEVSFKEAQKEIRRLKEELRKSEAVRAKLTSSTATQNDKKPMKPRKKLEYVNRF